jgi:uncharacterized protein YneF (UPF0154 family)
MTEQIQKLFRENPVLACMDESEIYAEIKRNGIDVSDAQMVEVMRDLNGAASKPEYYFG